MLSIPEELGVIQAGDWQAFTKLLGLPELQVVSLECADWRQTLFVQCHIIAPSAPCRRPFHCGG